MANGFSDVCSVAVGNTYSTCGTVTRSKIAVLTPTQIQALYQPSTTAGSETYTELNGYLKHQLEMKACGIRRSPLYDWVMSSNKRGLGSLAKPQRTNKGPLMLAPYILGRQQSLWNDDYWYVTANVAHGDYDGGGAGNLPSDPTSGRILTVKSSFASTLTPHADYFVAGKNIHLISVNSSTGAWSICQFKVIQAGVNGSDAIDVHVEVNQGTSGTIPTNSTSTSGIVITGINNVHDVEAWCNNMHNVNLNKLVPFWYQTWRITRCVDSEYKKIYAHMVAQNAWYAMFADLPLAERNRQDEWRAQKEWLNAFFWGEKISDNQTLTSWGSLDSISSATGAGVTPGTASMLIAKRANMIGVVPQLKACARFVDSAGAPLEIDTWLESTLYDIWRARSSYGRESNEIDVYTDQGTADEIFRAYIAYSKNKTGDIVRLNIDEGTTTLGFPFRRFKLYKPHGVFLNVLTDNYFDDQAAAFAAADATHPSGGKFLHVLDLGGSIYPAVLGSNRKQYTTGQINDLAKIDSTYACVMENPTIDRTLTSQTCTAIVECPLNSIVNANFEKVQFSTPVA